MKKYIFGAVLSLGILISPAFTQAAGLTNTQIQSILSLLSAFGADSATIANVTAALNGDTPTTGGQSFCHNFNTNLGVGSNSNDVIALDAIFSKEISGYQYRGGDHTLFDETTATAVVQFQAKYGILQSGYVGPLTRAKLNSLYGCDNGQPVTISTGFSVSPSSGQAPLATTFSFVSLDTSVSTNLLYEVDFGDNSTATGDMQETRCAGECRKFTAAHTYTTSGTYTAKLIESVSGARYGGKYVGTTIVTVIPTLLGTPSITSVILAQGTTGSIYLTVSGSGFSSSSMISLSGIAGFTTRTFTPDSVNSTGSQIILGLPAGFCTAGNGYCPPGTYSVQVLNGNYSSAIVPTTNGNG